MAIAAAAVLSGTAQAQLLTNSKLMYVFHAQEDPDGIDDGKWTHSENYYPGAIDADLTLTGVAFNPNTGSSNPNLSKAFTWNSNGDNATEAGSTLTSFGKMTREGSTETDSLAIELWIKPAAGQVNADFEGQYLLSTSSGNAGRGAYIKFNHMGGSTVNIELMFRRDQGMATATWTLDPTDSNANGLIDILENDFIQIVAMSDRTDAVRSANPYAYLSVNAGTPVTDSNITNDTAWHWNGQGNFGKPNNNPQINTLPHPDDSDGGSSTTVNTGFVGDIALIRIYDQALTDTELNDAFNSVAISGILGDFDGDGDVDGVDIAEMFSNFNGPGGGVPTNPDTDLDGDGDVDGVDIAAMFGAFTGPLSPANIPEPTSLALLGLGGLLITRRRQRQ